VKKLADNLAVPVCCKIRILPEKEKTMALVRGIEDAGCSILTVHGRTKEQNKHLVGAWDWQTIREIKQALRIPVFANGGIHSFADVEHCLQETGVDGVMSAESLLENPALFSGELLDLDDLALEYLEFWKKHDSQTPRFLKPHLFKILHRGLQDHVDLRERLSAAKTPEECQQVAEELKKRRSGVPRAAKFGWYERYQSYAPPKEQKQEPPAAEKRGDQPEGPEPAEQQQSEKKIKTE
jgi:tRNA-dihydrouridine synthase 1